MISDGTKKQALSSLTAALANQAFEPLPTLLEP
jgi:hypothetical protein